MFEYKVVKIGIFNNLEETLNEYAQKGWRAIQIISRMNNGNGPLSYEIVFEREKK